MLAHIAFDWSELADAAGNVAIPVAAVVGIGFARWRNYHAKLESFRQVLITKADAAQRHPQGPTALDAGPPPVPLYFTAWRLWLWLTHRHLYYVLFVLHDAHGQSTAVVTWLPAEDMPGAVAAASGYWKIPLATDFEHQFNEARECAWVLPERCTIAVGRQWLPGAARRQPGITR